MPTYTLTAAQLYGQGILNSFVIPSSGGSIDPDAQAFITAAGITDPTQQSAINTLVVGMKADNIWDSMTSIYPFVGGTATTHKYNLKDPRDLDAAYRLQFNGGVTHSNTGATPNGTNGYARTFINPSIVLSSTSIHFSNYWRTDSSDTISEFGCEVYVDPGENQYTDGVHTFLAFGSNYMFFGNGLQNNDLAVVTNNIGNYIVSRTTSSSNKLFKNGTLIKSNNFPSGNANSEMWLMGNKVTTIPPGVYGDRFGIREIAFCTIGAGLTDTQSTNLNTLIQSFQTTLGRQV